MNRLKLVVVAAAIFSATSALADELAVTVYNSNLGVISETRQLEFSKGTGRLAFRDVPSQIDAASVRFEVVDQNRQVSILEQNYAYDLVSPDQLFSKYIDNRVELVDKQGGVYSGTLLAYSGGAVTLMQEAGKVKIVSMGEVVETNFPSLPEGLITRPTLFWNYSSDFSGKASCRVGYQTSGLNWAAEYVGLLDQKETNLDLSGWASINNTSGRTYPEARLKLIAGDIHRAAPPMRKGYADFEVAAMATAPAGFEEKAFFEYHMYTLPRSATLANNETKQISLFEPASTAVKKVYYYRPSHGSSDVQVVVEFVNSAQAGLGMPLPAGRVRLFKADDDGSLILLGEDQIKHTPKDEEMALTVGTAFDIKAEERLVNQSQISKKVEEREFEIELRNRKAEAVTVKVEKQLWGFWEITQSTHEYKKKDASTVTFEVPVKAEDTTTVRFTVRFTNR
ncbi:MAG: DUF4139 domain-containing protein [Candidatus Zixiibacteriota bacterium]